MNKRGAETRQHVLALENSGETHDNKGRGDYLGERTCNTEVRLSIQISRSNTLKLS